jgi:hypothetical protein
VVNNSKGLIEAAAGSLVQLTGGDLGVDIQGGQLAGQILVVPNGIVELDGGTHGKLTIDGAPPAITSSLALNSTLVTVTDGASLELAGTIDNQATIQVSSAGDPTSLYIAGTVNLTGAGTVTLSDFLSNAIQVAPGAAGPNKLNNVDNTIQGAGIIGDGTGNLSLMNSGGNPTTSPSGGIFSTGANPLMINTGSAVTNKGLMEANSAGGLIIDDAVKNSGTLAAANGNLTVAGNVTGTGLSEIFSGERLELKGKSNTTAAVFENLSGDAGAFVLDHSRGAAFQGTVADMFFDGSSSDELVLQDIAFGKNSSWSFTQGLTGPLGELSVSDGKHTANIALIGQYLAAGASASSAGSSLFSAVRRQHHQHHRNPRHQSFIPTTG